MNRVITNEGGLSSLCIRDSGHIQFLPSNVEQYLRSQEPGFIAMVHVYDDKILDEFHYTSLIISGEYNFIGWPTGEIEAIPKINWQRTISWLKRHKFQEKLSKWRSYPVK